MAVNDEVWNRLKRHGGSSISQRVYNYLGTLGYTGTISDRLSQYKFSNRKGWAALIQEFAGVGGFTPYNLFSQEQNGLWADPLPIYLYEDEAGTIEDVVNGDPVGLGLDRHAGLVLGPEHTTDPTFDNPGDWAQVISGTNWTVTGGVATSDGSSGFLDNIAAPKFEAGKWYEVGLEVISLDSGKVSLPYDGAGGNRKDVATLGDHKGLFLCSSTTYSCLINGESFAGTIDNVTVKEIPGNHVTQPTSADRPTYGTDGTLHWLAHDGAGDHLVSSPGIDASVPEFWFFFAGRHDGGTDSVITSLSEQGTDFQYVRIDKTQVFVRAESSASNQATIPISGTDVNAVYSVRLRQSDRTMTVWKNQVQVGQVAIPGTVWFPALFYLYTSGGKSATSPAATRGYAYLWVLDALDAGTQDRVEKELAKKAGITL